MNVHLQRMIHGRLMDAKADAGGGAGGGDLTAADLKSMADFQTQFLAIHKQIKSFVEKANDEIKAAGAVSLETKTALASLTETINGLGDRIDKIEAKSNRIPEGAALKNLGAQFVDLADYKGIRTLTKKARLETDTFDIKAITNATGQNQPLVPDMRVPGVITTPNRRLRIRQLIPSGRTSSNLVQYVKENVFTNNAGPQVGGSPTVAGENQTKNESDITFTLANAPVVTIAHFILVSTQVLEDAPMLESYINGRLLYGLALEEEEEILLADGSVGQLTGLMASATAFNRLATGTKLDILRRAITQLQLSEYDPEFYVLNPQDWEEIELLKDTTNQYVIANPQSMVGPTLWGLPVVVTNTMPRGQFLCANGTQAAQIWDRMQAAVELSREDSDNFRKNMVTILAEERLALAIYRASALIKGDYSNLNAS